MPTYIQPAGSSDDALRGPFHGPVAFGSDPGRCQIQVAHVANVRPVHATLGPLHAGQHTLAPVSPDCRVFLKTPGKDQVWEVDAPVSAKVGATVFLGSPEGPGFVIRHGNAAAERALPEHEQRQMMGALDRALGTQVRALAAKPQPRSETPRGPVLALSELEIPTEALPRRRDVERPLVGCAVAALSGMVFGSVAFGVATFAVLRVMSGAG